MTDDEYKELFKAWAEYKYGIPAEQIEDISFDLRVEGPYSLETPDTSATVEVWIKAPTWSNMTITHEWDYPTDLIKDIMSYEARMRGKKKPRAVKRPRRTA